MNSQITASVDFFFRGKKISASVDLDLDHYMQTTSKIPPLFPLLARAARLDIYSYEYEMMQAEEILFSEAKGLASDYLNDSVFDIEGFTVAWKENRLFEELQKIAHQNLSIDDLQLHSELLNALLKAYQLGRQAPKSDDH